MFESLPLFYFFFSFFPTHVAPTDGDVCPFLYTAYIHVCVDGCADGRAHQLRCYCVCPASWVSVGVATCRRNCDCTSTACAVYYLRHRNAGARCGDPLIGYSGSANICECFIQFTKTYVLFDRIALVAMISSSPPLYASAHPCIRMYTYIYIYTYTDIYTYTYPQMYTDVLRGAVHEWVCIYTFPMYLLDAISTQLCGTTRCIVVCDDDASWCYPGAA